MSIIKADETNLKEWAEMSTLLFPELTYDEAYKECENWLLDKNEIGLLYKIDGKYAGFMNIAVRKDYVNGTDSSPVVFIEAIYVLPQYRKAGIGKEFIKYAEDFAKEQNISQIASDCLIDNSQSEAFHKSCGFIEKERVICFVKDIK